MSISEKSTLGGTATPASSVAAAPGDFDAGSTYRAPGGSDLGLYSLSRTFDQGSALTENAQTFLDSVTERLNKSGTLKVTTHKLNEPRTAHAIVAGNAGVILIFADQLPALVVQHQPFTPKSAYITREMKNALIAKTNANIKLLNVYLVFSQDYNRVTQYVNDIGGLLFAANSESTASITAQVMFGGQQITIDHDITAVRQYLSTHYPHSILPRTDFGFLSYVRKPNANTNRYDNAIQEADPFLAVGGYTDFVRRVDNVSGVVKWLPIVTLTSTHSNIKHTGISMLSLALAGQELIARGGWQTPLRNIAKGRPNIGNYIIDPATGKPYMATSVNEVEQILVRDFLPPMLAVHVVEGQSRAPALSLLTDEAGQAQMINIINAFFGSTIQFNHPSLKIVPEIIGHIGDVDGVLRDSREGSTYLDLTARHGSLAESANLLWGYYNDPSIRAKVVAEFNAGFTPQHAARLVVLNPRFIKQLADALRDSRLSVTSHMNYSQALPMDDLYGIGAGAELYSGLSISSGIGNNNNSGMMFGSYSVV